MHLVLLCPALLLALAARVANSDRLFCGKPPEIKHAYVGDEEDAADQLPDEYEVGTEVVYNCEFGYIASGRSRIIRCDQIGDDRAEWREPGFSCTPNSCGDPGHITNGFRVGWLFTFPNNVTYHCDVGYILRGIERKVRYCQTNGEWSGRLPVCEVVTCDHPKDIPNGDVTASSHEYGATLTYRCDNGYRLSSNEDIYCTENGTWSKTDLTCEEILCEMPEKPQFGYVTFRGVESSPRAGSIVIFSCEEGRILSGSTTSKCLDKGRWTFPAPKCLEPCTIQSISNGVIGKYVRTSYWRSKTEFKEMEVGARVEENEDLYIRCDGGFEALGTDKQEAKITCSKGRWSSELECHPASCLSRTPLSPNAKIIQIDRKHEGFVSYECFPDYKKTIEETVVCAYGRWNGKPPQCKPTKCSRDSLTYPGIVKGSKHFYFDGEVFSYTCDYPLYQKPAGHNGQITCMDGTWTGESPFCVAAGCPNPPPSIAHGKLKNLTTLHGDIAKYVCEDSYILDSNSLVQCSFGAWTYTGPPPKCRDSRCYLNNLSFKSNVSPLTQTVTSSGDKLNVICEEGYSPNKKLPVCEMGVWKKNSYEFICEESGCQIPRILHGSLNDKIMGSEYFNVYSFRYERKVEYKTISVGNTVPSYKVLFLFCEDRRTFQGTAHQVVAVQCIKGRWIQDPVCLRQGDIYIPTTTVKPRLSSTTKISLDSVTTSRGRNDQSGKASSKEFSSSTIPSRASTFLATEEVTSTSAVTDPTPENVEDDCTCYYPLNDSSVVAHANGKRLGLGDKVQDGVRLTFRCLHVGYHHLIGRTEITCADCRPWHSSDFPTCTMPKKGNVVVVLDDNVTVLEDGTLQINKGQNVNFTCIALETAEYPEWKVPDAKRISLKSESKERKGYKDILYLTYLNIQDADYSHVGPYDCFLKNYQTTSLNVTVIDPDIQCPEFPDYEDLIITYEMDRRENSKAFFSCTNKNLELVGEPSSTCLRTKEWSAPLPFCAARCKKLKDSDYLAVQYTNDQEVGSLASFHCFAPAIHIGVSYAECLKNGSWSHPTPICKDIRCKILNETDWLAINYSPPGDRKINSTATFHCYQPAKRTGVSSTKCLQNGSWANPIPTCKIPPCTAENLMSSLPHNAQPAVEIEKNGSFPVDSTVKLTCTNDMVVIGNPLATCKMGAKWRFDEIECGSGCQRPTRNQNSKLKLSSEKNVYKIGESVTFSCPPGMKLDSESQVIMCLSNGWTEDLPDCVPDDMKENFQTPVQDVPETSFA